MAVQKRLPLLPLRNIVVFPGMVAPLFVGRARSVKALEAAIAAESPIILVTQKEESSENPGPNDLYQVGTLARIMQVLRLPDNTVKLLVEGDKRVSLDTHFEEDDYSTVSYTELKEPKEDISEQKALIKLVLTRFETYLSQNKKLPNEVLQAAINLEGAGELSDFIAQHLGMRLSDRQDLLEQLAPSLRLEKVYGLMEGEMGVLQVEKKIRNRVKRQMEKSQREYFLNEQMKAIKRELGEADDSVDEIVELENRIAKTKLSKEAKEKVASELKKLKSMSPMSAEATVVRNYLDWILALPWKKYSKISHDLKAAVEVLDADHFGLEKVKERIIEYLAVQARQQTIKGPILCLVGPPGVGKTSLGKSIARATGREFVRMSLGGVRDEAEIRGHRRTYIGALPGKVIQGMKKAKQGNPLFLLDEIDKLGSDWRGDPSSALLEVLDPEQNNSFNDHYLELDYDLSQVMFVTTANSMNLPQPLLDRLEVIRIAGYTEDEKLEIARRHLIPKQAEAHGLTEGELEIADEALRDLVRYYTREAGVRNLEREIARLARKSVKKIVAGESKNVRVDSSNLKEFAGVRKFHYGLIDEKDQVGIINGLAFTDFGGDLLTIEAVTMAGDGKFTKTGKLGDVMQESIEAASHLIKSRAPMFGIDPEIFKKTNVHLHVPEGAIPKDGPSAGIAMATAIVSVLTGNPVRRDVAMTGEITLRGRVLPIGGLKEKLMAALRGGVKKVIIPKENEKDLEEVPPVVKDNMTIVPVSMIDEVLFHALANKLEPLDLSQAKVPLVEPVIAERSKTKTLTVKSNRGKASDLAH